MRVSVGLGVRRIRDATQVWGPLEYGVCPRLANANSSSRYTGIALATVISSAPLLSIQIVVNIE